MPHLAQQLTPDNEGLCFGRAVVLSSSFDVCLLGMTSGSYQSSCLLHHTENGYVVDESVVAALPALVALKHVAASA